MEFLKKNGTALLWGIIELALGILLILEYADVIDLLKILVIIVGIVLIVYGAYSIVKYCITPANEARGKYLYGGLVALALGIILLIEHSWFDSLSSWLISFVFALFLLFSGFEKVQSLVDKLRLGQKNGWVFDLVSAIVLIALAIIILAVDNAIVKLILGILLLLVGIYDIVVLIFLSTHATKTTKTTKKTKVIDVKDDKKH